MTSPSGCRHCGIDQGGHGRQWTTGVRWHVWTAPTQEQRKDRMHARRNARKEST